MSLNKYSARITQPASQGASQAMLYATGLQPADMDKPQVGIGSVWYEGNSCNMHLLDLAGDVKQGVEAAGAVGMRFNTVGVSDGISMGTDGMSFSLQSRDLIADSIETIMGGQWYDALVALPGCDKNMPGCIIAMGRLNRPAIMVYGGTIKAGCSDLLKGVEGVAADKLDIVSAFQSYGQSIAGTITEEQRQEIVQKSCPGAGACGGMYTANTMASAIEALGMSLPFSASIPAEDPDKLDECRRAGAAIHKLLELDLKPRDIMTRAAFENAMVVLMVLGGSTNAVLHLLAMARSVDVELTLDDFQAVADKTPLLADLKPSGKYVMEDLHSIGGTPAVMKYLLSEGMIDGSCMTCTGQTLAENLAEVPGFPADQDIVRPVANPIKPSGHLQILYGNVAPTGSVAKITGKEGLVFKGTAKCYDSEEDMLKSLEDGHITGGEVVVIRYEGPKGGPGMPEMLTPTSAIMGAGLGDKVALITDGRFSGGSPTASSSATSRPKPKKAAPIALLQDGDEITIDADTNVIQVALTDDELAARKEQWTMPAYKFNRGTLYKYIKNVTSASIGCVTDE